MSYLFFMLFASNQWCGAFLVGSGCGEWTPDYYNCNLDHLGVATATTNQKKEDITPPAPGEGGG